jgi:hydrogenase expression/formation protein HypC
MCLAVPARIEKMKGEYALADFGGLLKDIKTVLTPGIKAGDYVLVHAGFSIETIKEKEAAGFFRAWKEIM